MFIKDLVGLLPLLFGAMKKSAPKRSDEAAAPDRLLIKEMIDKHGEK